MEFIKLITYYFLHNGFQMTKLLGFKFPQIWIYMAINRVGKSLAVRRQLRNLINRIILSHLKCAWLSVIYPWWKRLFLITSSELTMPCFTIQTIMNIQWKWNNVPMPGEGPFEWTGWIWCRSTRQLWHDSSVVIKLIICTSCELVGWT